MIFKLSTISGLPNKISSFSEDIIWTFHSKDDEINKYNSLMQQTFFRDLFHSINVNSPEDYWVATVRSIQKRFKAGDYERIEVLPNGYRIGAVSHIIDISSISELVNLSKKVGCDVSISENTIYVHDTRRKCESA